MGAKQIFGALLGLIVIISLAAGRIIIQYPQNLNNEDVKSNQFNSYAEEKLNNYNGNNLRPYPYNSPTGYRSMPQGIPVDIQISYTQIPAMTQRMQLSMPPPPPNFTPRLSPYERLPVYDDIRFVKRSTRPTLDEILRRPNFMPAYYNERPTSNVYPFRSMPYERHLPFYDEERSVKRIENFDLENLDKIPDFMQKPIFPTLDLSNIMALSDVRTNDDEEDMEPIKNSNLEEFLDNLYKQPIFDFANLMALSADVGGNDVEEDVERIEPKANEPTVTDDDDNTDDEIDHDDEHIVEEFKKIDGDEHIVEQFKNIETFDEDKVAKEAAVELNNFIKELLTETDEDATNNLYKQLIRDVLQKSFNNENDDENRVVPEAVFDLEPEVAASTESTEPNENNYMVFLAHFFIDPEQGITLNTDDNEASKELAKSNENELIANVDEQTEIASKESTESKEETLVEELTESSENEWEGTVDEKMDIASKEEPTEEPLIEELTESSEYKWRRPVDEKMDIASKESTEPTEEPLVEELTESSEYKVTRYLNNVVNEANESEDSDEVPVHIIPLDDATENNKKFEYVVESGESNDKTDNVQPAENSDKVTVVVHNIGFDDETNEFKYLPDYDSDSDAEAMKNYLLYDGYF